MQNEADKWKKRGEALRKGLEETAKMAARDSEERQNEIDVIRNKLARLPEDEKVWADFVTPLVTYLDFEQRQIALCGQLVVFLEEFGNTLYDFFREGFYSDNPKLEHSKDYPPGYVLRTLLDQISIDLKIAQAAVYQRRHTGSKEFDPGQHAWTLYQADILGEHALQAAQDNGFLQQYTPVVTYFEKNLSTRLVPYYDLLLIGIPYTTLAEAVGYSIHISQENVITNKNPLSADLLAIPHEVGHYLFWKGQVPENGLTIEKYLQKRLERAKIRSWDWRRRWLEEIFADAYGCLVAGPVIVLDFQDRLTDNPPEHFRQDPTKHPIPVLRPFIQSRILRKIKAGDGDTLFKTAPDLLDAEWLSSIPHRLYSAGNELHPLEANYQIQGVEQPLKGEQIVDAVDEMVDLILEALLVPRMADASPSWTPWTSDLSESVSDVAALYQEFLNKFFFPKEEWLNYKAVSSELVLRSFQDELNDVTVNARDKAVAEGKWKELFLVRGWSTEGPEGDRIG